MSEGPKQITLKGKRYSMDLTERNNFTLASMLGVTPNEVFSTIKFSNYDHLLALGYSLLLSGSIIHDGQRIDFDVNDLESMLAADQQAAKAFYEAIDYFYLSPIKEKLDQMEANKETAPAKKKRRSPASTKK